MNFEYLFHIFSHSELVSTDTGNDQMNESYNQTSIIRSHSCRFKLHISLLLHSVLISDWLWTEEGHAPSLSVLQSKHMTSCYWGSSSSAAERHDPSLPYLEQYRIDPAQFTQLFTALAPWVCGSHTQTLSARLFRLLDQNQDGLVNFKEFITGLSESRYQRLRFCSGSVRLRLSHLSEYSMLYRSRVLMSA